MAGKFRTFLNHECQGPPGIGYQRGAIEMVKKTHPRPLEPATWGILPWKNHERYGTKKYPKSKKKVGLNGLNQEKIGAKLGSFDQNWDWPDMTTNVDEKTVWIYENRSVKRRDILGHREIRHQRS